MVGYVVAVEQAEDGGFGAWSPDLPGCVGLGDTVDECLADMQVAIGLYVEALRDRGEDVPQPHTIKATTLSAA